MDLAQASEIVLKLIGVIVNPWTFLILFTYIFFKKNCIDLLNLIIGKIKQSNKFHLKTANIEITAEETEAIKEEINTISYDNLDDYSKHDLSVEKLSEFKSTFKKLNNLDIYIFINSFIDSDKVVTDKESMNDIFLQRLLELNLISNIGKYKFGFESDREQNIWEPTPFGKFILNIHSNSIESVPPHQTFTRRREARRR